MLARTRENQRGRRGIVLVLILAVLGLMAVIGITFATFSGQSRISARNFAQSVNQPQRDELMDYALAQLISDTADIRSAIRGHSLARDMYGNDTYLDASGNSHPLVGGYLASRPDGAYVAPHNDPYFYVTAVAPVTGSPTFFDLTTNITVGDSTFYGYDFTRWTLRVSYTGARATSVPPIPPYTGVVSQTLEVLVDNGPTATAGVPRVFRVNINPTDQTTTLLNPTTPTPSSTRTGTTPSCRGTTSSRPPPTVPPGAHGSVHPRRPLAPCLQRPGHDHQRRVRQLPVQRPEPERRRAWTRITTRSTWRTGSWPCKAPMGR